MSVHPVTREDGREVWQVRWRDGRRNRARTFDLEPDAEKWDEHVRRVAQLGELAAMTEGESTTLEQWLEWWWGQASAGLAERTQEVYASIVDLHILPWLGSYKLSELRSRRVDNWLQELALAGVGAATINKAAAVLQSALGQAVRDELISRNPVVGAKKPSQRRLRTPTILRPADVERIRAALTDPRDRTLVAVLAYAGLRPESEALTLRWRQVGERSLSPTAGKRRGHPTTRVIDVVFAPLRDDLAEWRGEHPDPQPGALVFPAPGGKPAWSHDDWRNWRRRVYRPAAIAAGLPGDSRTRDLRNSYATLLIWAGCDVVYVAKQLGHSATMCLDTYAGVFAEYDPAKRVDAEQAIREARKAIATS